MRVFNSRIAPESLKVVRGSMIVMQSTWLIAGVTFVVAQLLLLWVFGAQLNLPKLQPKSTPKRSTVKRKKFQTFRISNIPQSVTKEQFREALNKLSGNDAEGGSPSNISAFSFEPSAAFGLADRFRVACVTFVNSPDVGKLESTLKGEIGVEADRLRTDTDFFGTTPIYSPPENPSVDIIAVTGLSGHAFGSWKARGESAMWLRDFLPDSVPRARILTYGYDTKLPGSQSEASITDLSRRLLESIKTTRGEKAKRTRPLVFIGHSLGGLVVKQALVEAFEGSDEDKTVFRCCFGLLFFGVPNRGLENSSLMAMVRGQPNESLVRDLSGSSRFLGLLHRLFNKTFTLEDSTIISIYETKATPAVQWSPETGSWDRTGPAIMMVEQASATHAGPSEMTYDQISIDADHSGIVKFEDQSNPDYVIIASRLTQLVEKGPIIVKARFAEYRRKLSRLETQFTQSLNVPNYGAFRNDMVDDPTPGTLTWILDQDSFSNWRTSEEPAVLWIKGSAGQGKTTLSKFLLTHMEKTSAASPETKVIYYFFYGQSDILSTVGYAVRSLIRQLLNVRDVDTFGAIAELVELDNTADMSEDGLWEILEHLLKAPVLQEVLCVIDGLDECQNAASRLRLIRLFSRLAHPNRAKNNSPVVRTIFTSRPTVDIEQQLSRSPSFHLVANPQDLQVFVNHEIGTLDLDPQLHNDAVRLLLTRAEQTFLWISLIVKKLKAEALLSLADIERIIKTSPSDLGNLYQGIVSDILARSGESQKKLLLWVVYGRRPLTLSELEDALSIQEDSDSIDSIRSGRARLTKHNISRAVGIIIDIRDIDDRLYLIHQSARDFLITSDILSPAAFCWNLKPNLYLAKACLIYLCFEDFGSDSRIDFPNTFLLRYASQNWHRHIGNDLDGMHNLASLILRITEPRSSALLTWGAAAGLYDIHNATTRWDVATQANITWLADFETSGTIISPEKVSAAADNGMAGYRTIVTLIQSQRARFTDEAVVSVARYFDSDMVHLLLERQDSRVEISEDLLIAAARNRQHGVAIIRSLIESGRKIHITNDVLKVILDDRPNRREIVDIFAQSVNATFTEQAVEQMVKFGDWVMIRSFLDEREDCDTPDTMHQIVSAQIQLAEETMIRLVNRSRLDIEISDAMIKEMALNGVSAFKSFLNKFGHGIIWSEDFLQSLAQLEDEKPLEALIETRGDDIMITDAVLESAILNKKTVKTARLILGVPRWTLKITDGMAQRVASAGTTDMMALLLETVNGEIKITDDLVKSAFSNDDHADTMVSLLFENHGPDLLLSEEVVEDVAWLGKPKSAATLLRVFGTRFKVTERLLQVAAAEHTIVGEEYNHKTREFTRPAGDFSLLELLIQNRRADVEATITEEVCMVAASVTNRRALDLLCGDDGFFQPKKQWYNVAKLRSEVINRHPWRVRDLLLDDTPPNVRDFKTGMTPLCLAAFRGFFDVVNVLLWRKEVLIDAQDWRGRTPLFWAYQYGYNDVVTLLRNAGADDHLKDDRGLTPIEAGSSGAEYLLRAARKAEKPPRRSPG
ncbi:unnamed protein product, partial [Clonostachys rosea]